MKLWKYARELALLLLCWIFLTACAGLSEPAFESSRREQAGDICLTEHAGPYIEHFQSDYPNMAVTKVRWQTLQSGKETYIIEGVADGRKNIVKYLMGDDMVLGRIERSLNDTEVVDGVCSEKPVPLEQILTHTELCAIVQQELGGKMLELRISWKGDVLIAYAEVIDEHNFVKGLTLNAVTGEILY